jgi:hypothetical protein
MKIDFPCKCGHLEKDHFSNKNEYGWKEDLMNYCRICKMGTGKVCLGYEHITDTNEIIATIKKNLDKQNG